MCYSLSSHEKEVPPYWCVLLPGITSSVCLGVFPSLKAAENCLAELIDDDIDDKNRANYIKEMELLFDKQFVEN
jgi:hypothetical protein